MPVLRYKFGPVEFLEIFSQLTMIILYFVQRCRTPRVSAVARMNYRQRAKSSA